MWQAATSAGRLTPGWLVSAALVMMMTGPGLVRFLGGVVREKNNSWRFMLAELRLIGADSRVYGLWWAQLWLRRKRAVSAASSMRFLAAEWESGTTSDYAAGTISRPSQLRVLPTLMFASLRPALIHGCSGGAGLHSGTRVSSDACGSGVSCAGLAQTWVGAKGRTWLNASGGGKFPCRGTLQEERWCTFSSGRVGAGVAPLVPLGRYRISKPDDARRTALVLEFIRRVACCG